MARNPNRGSGSNKPKTYTDKNRPSGFYNVAGKGKRYWNAYTKSWSKSPLGSTDKMLGKATGRDVTATTQQIKKTASGGASGGASGASGRLKIKPASNSGTPRSRTENRRSTTTSPSSSSGPKRPEGATGGRGGSTYRPRPVRGPLKDKNKDQTTTTTSSSDKDTNTTPTRPKHGANTARINELMTKWKAAKGADKDRLGRQIHRLKYEKTAKGLKIRKKPLSKAGELGWKGRTEA